MSDPKDLVSVYEAANSTEAHFVRNLLVDEGIDAVVSEDHEPLASLPIAAPNVLVRQADEIRARATVNAYDAEQLRRATRPDWPCPKCGANVVGAFDLCDVCGTDRPGTGDDD